MITSKVPAKSQGNKETKKLKKEKQVRLKKSDDLRAKKNLSVS